MAKTYIDDHLSAFDTVCSNLGRLSSPENPGQEYMATNQMFIDQFLTEEELRRFSPDDLLVAAYVLGFKIKAIDHQDSGIRYSALQSDCTGIVPPEEFSEELRRFHNVHAEYPNNLPPDRNYSHLGRNSVA